MMTASLSLDLDNKWSYMKTHGDAGWESFPTYLDAVVPAFLDVLDDVRLKMTVMIVGQDAAQEKNHAALRLIPENGHEVGNHSFHHEPWLHLYSKEEIEKEVITAEDAIESASGVRPTGWRGPGFSFSPDLLSVLARRGYKYDGSTFPTYLGPLARAYYFMKSGLGKQEKDKRKQLFGKFTEGFRPLKPYHWDIDGQRLLEIPVTTFPLIKAPFHVSYLLYLATFSEALSKVYFAAALKTCKLAGIGPSLLLHPLDFVGDEVAPELAFFPAMNKGGEWKRKLVRGYLRQFAQEFDVVPMGEHARRLQLRQIPIKESAPVAEASSL
ncbi:MAG: polysaccharide deacetylase family protein [Verrucomicrobiota bacterium]